MILAPNHRGGVYFLEVCMLPERKKLRLKSWDYSTEGAYFLTICSKDRKCIFSHIVGRDILDAPDVQLSQYGQMVQDSLFYLSEKDSGIVLHNWVIMPNHVHILVSVTNEGMLTKSSKGTKRPTEAVVPRYVSSLKRFTNKKSGGELWQNGYYDHIIRDDNDFILRWRYIDNNPYAWLDDDYYVE